MQGLETYRVKKGDTIQAIAKQYHHRKWETIWSAAENKTLVSKRKKPEALQPGDQLTIPLNEKQQQEIHTLIIKGKKYVLDQKEFDEFNKELLSTLKRAVTAAEQRVVAARVYWQLFDELNREHWCVNWVTSLAGPKLPAEGLVKAGEQAHEKLKSAVSSKDFKKIHTELKNARRRSIRRTRH